MARNRLASCLRKSGKFLAEAKATSHHVPIPIVGLPRTLSQNDSSK